MTSGNDVTACAGAQRNSRNGRGNAKTQQNGGSCFQISGKLDDGLGAPSDVIAEQILNESQVSNGHHNKTLTDANKTNSLVEDNYKVCADEKEKPADPPESESSYRQRVRTILLVVGKLTVLIVTLYFFICSLDLLSAAFTLLAGWSAGAAFQSPLLQNPVCGLMIGVMTTAILQSSSTSSSIVITMVAAGILSVETAIPIIMGANIGTSVTGVIVAVTQAGDKDTFRKAFSAATVHDMFNWLTVMILLPVEVATGYLYHVTSAIVASTNLAGGGEEQQFLSVITDPFTELIVQLDKSVLDDIARGDPEAKNKSMLLYWCEYESQPVQDQSLMNIADTSPLPLTTMVGTVTCTSVSSAYGWGRLEEFSLTA